MNDAGEETLKQLIADLAEGRTPVLEFLQELQRKWAPDGDYEGFLAYRRFHHALTSDSRIAERLMAEVKHEVLEHIGGIKGERTVAQNISRREGSRRFGKYTNMKSEFIDEGPSLISGATFDECLSQYKTLIGHVEQLWVDAGRHFLECNYPLAVFLAILAIEEIGKLGRLWSDLMSWDAPQGKNPKTFGKLACDHRKKHFMGVVSGALINSRLDRILGEQQIERLLRDAESGKIEHLRQSCLYVDVEGGRIVVPKERIGQEDARFYCVLAGELWAEVLGHFPWDFKHMQEKVIKFELAAGLDPSLVAPKRVSSGSGVDVVRNRIGKDPG